MVCVARNAAHNVVWVPSSLTFIGNIDIIFVFVKWYLMLDIMYMKSYMYTKADIW